MDFAVANPYGRDHFPCPRVHRASQRHQTLQPMDHSKSTGKTVTLLALAATIFFFQRSCAEAQIVNLTAHVQASSTISLLIQNDYRWYANADVLTPVTPDGAENASITTPAIGINLRLRMNIKNIGGVTVPAGATFELQYANATTGPWTNITAATAWAFWDNPSVADGQILGTLLLGSSTTGESYGESNPSAASPAPIASGTYGEW